MAKPAAGAIPLEKLELYEKLVATNPNVERKGDTVPYTSLNGHMFSYLSKEGKLALRLPAGEREAFLKKYKAKLCEAYGTFNPRGRSTVIELDLRSQPDSGKRLLLFSFVAFPKMRHW
jgi:hypothetical protein